ncbi:hypothetical protein HK097_010217 [Rhizophlyctis rosea]|uniref:PKD/REJ-like domain-containing protein n=1 Tax=Rhizophlyctis rosea TaxID=64517 RepID=A0AAD5SKF4_9FUNG|nr:hypothetical protein HK097_010217 [Rhizophlyctis rosea]
MRISGALLLLAGLSAVWSAPIDQRRAAEYRLDALKARAVVQDVATADDIPASSSSYSSAEDIATTSSSYSSAEDIATTSSSYSSAEDIATTSSPYSSAEDIATTSSPATLETEVYTTSYGVDTAVNVFTSESVVVIETSSARLEATVTSGYSEAIVTNTVLETSGSVTIPIVEQTTVGVWTSGEVTNTVVDTGYVSSTVPYTYGVTETATVTYIVESSASASSASASPAPSPAGPAPKPKLQINGAPSSMSYCDELSLSAVLTPADGTLLQNVKYTWSFSQDSQYKAVIKTPNQPTLRFASGDLQDVLKVGNPGDTVYLRFSLDIQADILDQASGAVWKDQNLRGLGVQGLDTYIKVGKTVIPTVVPGVGKFYEYVLGERITIQSSVTKPACLSALPTTKQTWTIYDTAKEGQIITPAGAVLTGATLVIPGLDSNENPSLPYSAQGYTVRLTTEVQYFPTDIYEFTITQTLPNLIARIQGGDRTVGINSNVTLDAHNSYDPAYPSGNVVFTWSCTAYNKNKVKEACAKAILDAIAVDDDEVTLTKGTLTGGYTYEFGVYVTSKLVPTKTRTSDIATVKVTVNADLTFGCIVETIVPENAKKAVGRITKVATNYNIGFRAACDTIANLTYSWTFANTVSGKEAPLLNSTNLATGTQSNQDFYFKPGTLMPGESYTATVTAVLASNTQLATTATTQINIMNGPIIAAGVVRVTPSTGVAYTDTFSAWADSFQAGEGGNTLTYSFVFIANGVAYPIGSNSSILPQKSTIPGTGTGYVQVTVIDNYNNVASKNSTDQITVNPITIPPGSSAAAVAVTLANNQFEAAKTQTGPAALTGVFAVANNLGALTFSQTTPGQPYDPAAKANTVNVQDTAIAAMREVLDANTGSVTPEIAGQLGKALGNLDFSIMPAAAVSKGASLVGDAASAYAGGTTPMPADVGGSLVGASANIFSGTSKSALSRRRLLARQNQQTVTFPVNNAPTEIDAATEALVLTALHRTGQALVIGGVCNGPPISIAPAGSSLFLAGAVVNLNNPQASAQITNVGTLGAKVTHPSGLSVANGANFPDNPGCGSVSIASNPGLKGAKASAGFTTDVISISYQPAVAAAVEGKRIDFVFSEPETAASTTNIPQIYWYKVDTWVNTGCTVTAQTVSNGRNLVTGYCELPQLSRRLRKRADPITNYDFAVKRVAQTTESPSPSPSPPPEEEKKGISGGGIAGIVIGCAAGAAIIGGGAFWFIKKR